MRYTFKYDGQEFDEAHDADIAEKKRQELLAAALKNQVQPSMFKIVLDGKTEIKLTQKLT